MERETWASPIRVAAGVGTETDVLRSSRWPPASESLSQRSHRQPPAAQCRQRRRYALGLSPASTHPLLSALVGHAYLTCRFRGRFQCFSAPQSRSQKRRYHNDRETQIRQYELGQQRHRPAACLVQIPPYSDHTVPTKLHDRPHVETVAHQSLLRFASWTCGRPTSIRFLD